MTTIVMPAVQPMRTCPKKQCVILFCGIGMACLGTWLEQKDAWWDIGRREEVQPVGWLPHAGVVQSIHKITVDAARA